MTAMSRRRPPGRSPDEGASHIARLLDIIAPHPFEATPGRRVPPHKSCAQLALGAKFEGAHPVAAEKLIQTVNSPPVGYAFG
jgi:hypothetical protein